MKSQRFEACVGIVLAHEGGFVDHPDDPGGATNFGITHGTLAAHRGSAVSVQDVRELTRAEAKAIYHRSYWKTVQGDDLPVGIDLVVFDFGVNAGVARSVKLLQRVLGVDADGIAGEMTLAAARAADPRDVIVRFGQGRMAHYRALKTWSKFGRGWTRRTEGVERQALLFASGAETGADDIAPIETPKADDRPSVKSQLRTELRKIVTGGAGMAASVLAASGSAAQPVQWALAGVIVAGFAYLIWRTWDVEA
ncbi:glycoside hydrolase family 108 protein [Meridianimarinicoccus sp. RP-17]|uniref:glycoside hydrolase family 108 protein n=1 Tax=Meridianimarinicoccus zhengii TaxID=2056810 RepID=UPI000DACA3D1|nr:glycoside hydrolase family 108 protein [Phycocomes zhengii]